MKHIRIHSNKFITQLNTRGPIFSVIEVSEEVYKSIVSSGHVVEVIEKKPLEQKLQHINKLDLLKIKPKVEENNVTEEEVKEEVEENNIVREEVKEEEVEKVKTKLNEERITKPVKKNNGRGKRKLK